MAGSTMLPTRHGDRKILFAVLVLGVCLFTLLSFSGPYQPHLSLTGHTIGKGRGQIIQPVGILLVADSSKLDEPNPVVAATAVSSRLMAIQQQISQLSALQKVLSGGTNAAAAMSAATNPLSPAAPQTQGQGGSDTPTVRASTASVGGDGQSTARGGAPSTALVVHATASSGGAHSTGSEESQASKQWFSYMERIQDAQRRQERIKKHLSLLPDGDENPTLPVRWYAPFFSGGGYCSEAISFVTSLKYVTPFQIFQLGDSIRQKFVDGLDRETLTTLKTMQDTHLPPSKSITICHTPPSRWEPALWTPAEAVCPPPDALYKIGRTMFETDGIPAYWAERMNKMDAIWVPSKFNYQTFALAGVYSSKLRVVPEAVDVEFFNPDKWEPSKLIERSGAYNFLSVFKWEERKGWRFLIQAYLEEFSSSDNTVLYILTNQDKNSAKMQQEMAQHFVTLNLKTKDTSKLPEIRFLPRGIPTQELPALYKAADCFVLPSRGEGWGRPHVEAMSMALPVVVTKWSGPEEFLTDDNSFPLSIDGLEAIEESYFEGFRWAKPSVKHLRQLMRYVMTHPQEAKRKGQQARKDMVRRFCPECVAKIVVEELRAIEKKLGAKPEYSPSFSYRQAQPV